MPFNNQVGGTVFVNDGTLVFAGGGSQPRHDSSRGGGDGAVQRELRARGGGHALISQGNLDFNTSTVSLDGNLTIDGELTFNSATATVKANATATSLALVNSTATVAAGGLLSVGAGGVSFGGTNNNSITLQPSATTPGKLLFGGNVSFTATGGSGALNTADFTVSQTPGLLDLGGATRTFTINEAPAAVDLAVSARIINGAWPSPAGDAAVRQPQRVRGRDDDQRGDARGDRHGGAGDGRGDAGRRDAVAEVRRRVAGDVRDERERRRRRDGAGGPHLDRDERGRSALARSASGTRLGVGGGERAVSWRSRA